MTHPLPARDQHGTHWSWKHAQFWCAFAEGGVPPGITSSTQLHKNRCVFRAKLSKPRRSYYYAFLHVLFNT
eukprot:4624822-Amphidinium_carterae.1